MDHWLPPCGCAVSTFLRLYDGDGPLGKFLELGPETILGEISFSLSSDNWNQSSHQLEWVLVYGGF